MWCLSSFMVLILYSIDFYSFKCINNSATDCITCDSSMKRVLVGGSPGECKCLPGLFDDDINELCK